jgi:opacity protein-like surface antigen
VKSTLAVIALAAALFVASQEANASCPSIQVVGMTPVQSALHLADLVFVGDVDHVELRIDALRQHVRFRVTQRFKGTVAVGQTLEFGYSGENFEFKTGQRVLVYAVNARGAMSTACTRTRIVAAADKELDELQTLTTTVITGSKNE